MSAEVAEFVAFEQLAEAAPAWRDLCARALEPNPFADPDFLLPLLAYERPRRLAFAVVREEGRLIGFAALILPPVGLARAWTSPYAALPAVAFDRDAAPAALDALLRLVAERTRLVGVVWPFVERDGPFAAALRSAAGARPLEVAAPTRRAALRLAGVTAFETSLDAKRRTKWARQARKLGKIEEASAETAVAAFFEIERKGWKGARRSALADDPRRLAFARAALGAFARADRLNALALTSDGTPVAAGLVLIAAPRAFYWKTAYDETHAAASPGVQLTLAHSRRLAATPGLTLVDSCAAEDHPMIGRVWSDTLEFETPAIGLRAESGRPLRVWLALDAARLMARAAIKRAIMRLPRHDRRRRL